MSSADLEGLGLGFMNCIFKPVKGPKSPIHNIVTDYSIPGRYHKMYRVSKLIHIGTTSLESL